MGILSGYDPNDDNPDDPSLDDSTLPNYSDDDYANPTPAGSIVAGSKTDLYGKYSKILGQDNPALGIIKSYLDSKPQRSDFEGQDKWKNAVLGFSQGMSGIDVMHGDKNPLSGYYTAKGLSDQPFLDARQDWADQAKQVDTIASLSSKQQEDKVRAAQWDMTSELNHQKQTALEQSKATALDEKKREAQAREDQNKQTEADRHDYRSGMLDVHKGMLANSQALTDLKKETLEDRRERLGGGDGTTKLDPYQKLGLDRYKTLSTPLDMNKRKQQIIDQNPQVGAALSKLNKGADLTDEEKNLISAYTDAMNKPDDRLLNSLHFGE